MPKQPHEYDENDEMNRENCVAYAVSLGYYTHEQVDALWPESDDPEDFFSNYVGMKHDDEMAYPCKCGNSTVYAHPFFGVTFGFGPAGACTCDGQANLDATPTPTGITKRRRKP